MIGKIKRLLFVITSIVLLSIISGNTAKAEDIESFKITESCIGKVCIGDHLGAIKKGFPDYTITHNDTQTGYYLFDELGIFLLEFSTKNPNETNTSPIRYIMTSNPKFFCFDKDIHADSKISDLEDKFGSAEYFPSPNGYYVKFKNWPIKESVKTDKYETTTIVSINNLLLLEMNEFTGSLNEDASIKLLKKYPDTTLLNTIEIYSDLYSTGTPIK